MKVDLNEVTEKVHSRISSLENEKAQMAKQIEEMGAEQQELRTHLEAIDAVSHLAARLADQETLTSGVVDVQEESRESAEEAILEAATEETNATPSEPELLTPEAEPTRVERESRGGVLDYLRGQLDSHEEPDPRKVSIEEAVNLRI